MFRPVTRLALALAAAATVAGAPAAQAQGSYPISCTDRVCVDPRVHHHFDFRGVDANLWGSVLAINDLAALAPSYVGVEFTFPGVSPPWGHAGPVTRPLSPAPGGLVGTFGLWVLDVPLPHWGRWFERPVEVRLTFTDAPVGGNVIATETVSAWFTNAPEPATLALTAGGLLALAGIARRRRA